MRQGSMIVTGMSTKMRWRSLSWVLFVITFYQSSAQTTTTAPITTTTNFPLTTEGTTTTLESTTPLPLLTTEPSGTTLTAADSAAPTTTVATESANYEATTEGQASNDAVRSSGPRRPFRFESTRNRPSENQEAAPAQEPSKPPKEKTEEKKIAWKFGRGGNSQEGWSVRPTPNSGYPLWKKETPAAPASSPQVEQGAEADSKKNNDQQAYIVWSVGQGNAPNGWALNGGSESWPTGAAGQQQVVPGGWSPAGASGTENANPGGWNADEWADDQSSDEEEGGQDEWAGDEPSPVENTGGGWNAAPAGWAPPAGNAGGWTNGPPQAPVENAPPQNGWAPPANNQGNGWNTVPGNANGAGGWTNPQQGGNGWAPQQQKVAPQSNGGQVGGNPNAGGWQAPASPNGAWNNAAPAPANGGGGWNNNQGGGWNTGSPGGIQDAGLSWKVYNEDTKTMENIDDNSGWKVVGDGGPDGWKLVDESGNVEWKIENVNGEWKVTSAGDLPKPGNSTAVLSESANVTAEAGNGTSSEEIITTTPTSNGGWDDDKQGRYVVWKFSEDGKGEARVYGGGGAEPEVWTVGDNNQYWKALNAKAGANSGQETWTADEGSNPSSEGAGGGGSWNANGGGWEEGGWQNTAQQPDQSSWQNQPQLQQNIPPQNNGWQAGGGAVAPQVTGGRWKSGGSAPSTGAGWQSGQNASPPPGNNRGWQTPNTAQQNGGNGWQQKSPAAPKIISWNNGAPASPQGGGWQNQAPQTSGSWNAANKPPQNTGGWQNTSPQVANGGWKDPNAGTQAGWQNGPAAPQQSGGWASGKKGRKGRTKGRWVNNGNRGRNNNDWQPNRAGNTRKNGARGSYNNRNRGGGWNQGNAGTTPPASWNSGPSPSVAPPTNPNAALGTSWQEAKAGRAGGWSGGPKPGQTVPYIIVIKSPDGTATPAGATNSWANNDNSGNSVNPTKTKVVTVNKPRNNRRSSGWKMNRAGSSGWQWNPQGGSEGWRWMDGWMGSGGGFGGWVGDKDTMYSAWKPTKGNGASQTATKPSQRVGGNPKANKKSASKMVFVFGTKRSSQGGWAKPNAAGSKKGKQVIILDYTTAGKKVPKGDDGMKKDIESVIQALKTGKPTGNRGASAWKQAPQLQNSEQWKR